jgi:hypothetical protein
MASFAESVFNTFGELTARHGFVPARAVSGKTFASLARTETQDIVDYVFVHDGRPDSANLDVSLWVAPPEQPDHALEKLYLGFKIQIGSEYTVDEAFFLKCQRRIINLLPSIRCLVPAITSDLPEPAFQSARYSVYQMERRAVFTVLRAAEEGSKSARAALDEVRRLALGKGKIDKISEACISVSEELLTQGRLEQDIVEHCRGSSRALANGIGRQLYIRSLCEQSQLLLAPRR